MFNENRKQRLIGILCALASGVLFGVSPTFVSIVNQRGVSSYTVCFLRFLISTLLFLAYITIRRIDVRLSVRHLSRLFLASLCNSLTTIALYSCYRYIGISAGTTIHFSYPILVVLFTALLFKEKPERKCLICTVLCIAGVAFFFEKQSGTADLNGIILALSSAFLYSFYLIVIERTGISKIDPVVMGFYIALFNMLIIGAYDLFISHQISLQISVSSWIFCALVSMMTSVFATLCLQIAIRHTSSILFSLLSLSEPISSVLCGFLILHEPFSIRKAIGCVIIIASLLYLIGSDHQGKNVNNNS
ncbi:MAG: DMT family transporter [Erysipelotrichaceae bacterium]|nr:DMT family transporter [Erysipelotrichaceae bacterium]